MSTPTLGKTRARKPLPIDVERLISSRVLLAAMSGAGKSWALRRILEQTHGQVQQLVIDPEGEFFTLREKYDYVLAGRDGGDCPAEPRSADLLARRLLELGVSAVLDIADLKRPERELFVTRFLEGLVNAPRKLWHPVLVVVDEAHEYAPESGKKAGGRKASTDAVIDLMARGRKRGYCGMLATQRLSKLSKDAAAEAGNVLIGRSTLQLDVKMVVEMLGLVGREEQQRVKKLGDGDFFVFGPALSDEVKLVKVGDVQTTHPRAGKLAPPPPPPRARIREVLGELADLPAEAQQEARTAEELRRRIRDLERELRQASAGAPVDTKQLDEARAREREAEASATALRTELGRVAGRIDSRSSSVARHLETARLELEKAADAVRAPIDIELPQRPAPQIEPEKRNRPVQTSARPAAAPRALAPIPAGDLPGPQQRILDAIAWFNHVRLDEPTKVQIAAVARYAVNGGGFRNPLGAARTAGLVEYRAGDAVVLTDAGRELAQHPEEAPTVEEMHRRVLETLPGNTHRRILLEVLEVYPEAIDAEELAARVGMAASGGGFRNPLGRLRTLGLIDYPERGQVVALPVLFLE